MAFAWVEEGTTNPNIQIIMHIEAMKQIDMIVNQKYNGSCFLSLACIPDLYSLPFTF